MPNLDSGGAGVRLTAALLRSIFPDAPGTIIDAFVDKQGVLSVVGVNQTRQRMAYFFANIHHETAGFTIKLLTENINYSAARMAQFGPIVSNRRLRSRPSRARRWAGKRICEALVQ